MGPSVVFVPFYEWHKIILHPLFKRVERWVDSDEINFNQIVSGSVSGIYPKIIVVCDAGIIAQLREYFPDSVFFHVSHGLISKNLPSQQYQNADYVCVASKAVANWLTVAGSTPRRGFLSTGYIQTDPLFTEVNRLKRKKSSGTKKRVLYAPTWNPTLTSSAMFGERVIHLLRGLDSSIEILIKPHPHLPVVNPGLMAAWQDLANREPNVSYFDETKNIVDCAILADVMVSDASSAIFHFLALNRPLVLIDNPDRFSDPSSFDSNGIEWAWRDIGDSTDDINMVKSLVSNNLNDPTRNLIARKKRRRELFGGLTDGKSLIRVEKEIRKLVRGNPRVQGILK